MTTIQPVDPARLTRLDRVAVTGVEVFAHHGVFAHERRDGQTFRVDAVWWQDSAPAALADDLDETTNYAEVAQAVVRLVQDQPVDLIETLARRLQTGLLERFPAMEAVQVVVHKPDAPIPVAFADVLLTTAPVARRADPRPVVFSLGSNIEPRWQWLQFAVDALAATPGIERLRVSGVYETAAVGVEGHDDYLNAVVTAWSALPAHSLLSRALAVEQLAHRTRVGDHDPRTLDIDLIQAGDETSRTPALTLPHPRAHQRAFVLRPWLDLDPAARLRGRPLGDWLAEVADQVVRPVAGELFTPESPRHSRPSQDMGAEDGCS